MRAHPLFDELECALVLEHFGQLRSIPLIGREGAHLPGLVPHELGVLGEAPAAPAVSRLADVLIHLGEAHDHGSAGPRPLLSGGGQDRKPNILNRNTHI